MKMHEADDESSIRALLDYLNVCHDGYIRRISFLKDRSYTEEGDVSWPCESTDGRKDEIRCDIEMELLLNSYIGASPKQIVLLYFQEATSFRFFQEVMFDYSEVLELVFHKIGEDAFEFVFRVRREKQPTDVLRLVCPSILCIELDR